MNSNSESKKILEPRMSYDIISRFYENSRILNFKTNERQNKKEANKMNSFLKRQRQASRRNARTQVSQNLNGDKILLVGPSQSEKSDFVKSFLPPSQPDNYEEPTLFSLGVNVTPIKYEGKNYGLWDANPYHDTHHDENLLLSSKGAKLIVVFADEKTWFDRMKELFPQIPVKMYNPESKLANLQ